MSNSENKPLKDLNTIWCKFGTRTTIQGISHYHQHSGTNGKWWLMCALIGIILTTIHMYLHAQNLFSMPIKSNVIHKSNDFVFPDITMCSTSPLVGELYFNVAGNVGGGFTARDAMAFGLLHSLADIKISDSKIDKQMHRETLYMQMSTTYTLDRGYSKDELISQCTYKGEPCSEDDIQIISHANYFNCFTFRPKNRNFDSLEPEDGLLLILNTHSTSLSELQQYQDNQRSTNGVRVIDNVQVANERHQASNSDTFASLMTPENEPAGLKLEIHPPRTHPHMRQQGIILSNGRYFEIGVNMLAEEQLDTPSSPCNTGNTYMNFKRYIRKDGSIESAKYEKTYDDCIGIVKQRHFLSTCGCYSHYFPFEYPHSGELCYNYTSSLNRVLDGIATPTYNKTHWFSYINFTDYLTNEFGKDDKRRIASKFRQRLKCHDELYGNKRELASLDGLSQCLVSLPCHREKYWWNWCSADWPRDFDLDNIINQTLLSTFHNALTGDLSRTAKLFMNFSDDRQNWSTTDEVIRRNFLKVLVHPLDLKVNVHQEEFAYTVWEALSEIGGIFGLWIGMSLLAVLEIIELVCNVVLYLVCYKKRQKQEYKATPTLER